jgi:hypothetical protein
LLDQRLNNGASAYLCSRSNTRNFKIDRLNTLLAIQAEQDIEPESNWLAYAVFKLQILIFSYNRDDAANSVQRLLDSELPLKQMIQTMQERIGIDQNALKVISSVK